MNKLLALASCVALLGGCASPFPDIAVSAAENDTIDLKGFGTYAWAAEAAVVRDPEGEWTPSDLDIGAEIRFLVDRELRDKGLLEVVESPDMLVIYGVGVDMESLDIVVDQDGEQFTEVPRGDLVVVLVDAESRHVAWVGAATGELQDEPTAELTQARLDHAISRMFTGYRP